MALSVLYFGANLPTSKGYSVDEMNEVVNDLATFIDLSFKNTKSRSFVNEDCSSCCSKQDQAGFSILHSGSRPRYLVSYGRYGCALSRMRLDRIIKRCSKFQTFFLFCSEFLVRFFGKIAILADLLRSSGTPFPWCLFFRMYFFNGVFPDLPGEGL